MKNAFNRKSQMFSREYARALVDAVHAADTLATRLRSLRYDDEEHVDQHFEAFTEAEDELRKALKRLAPFH